MAKTSARLPVAADHIPFDISLRHADTFNGRCHLLFFKGNGAVMASATVGGGPRPDLEATSVVNCEVELKFVKNGFTGVEIECQRGSEAAYSFLARDTEAPYIDTRANLSDGPETRRYRARYLQKDAVIADYSDVLVVTVPGKA